MIMLPLIQVLMLAYASSFNAQTSALGEPLNSDSNGTQVHLHDQSWSWRLFVSRGGHAGSRSPQHHLKALTQPLAPNLYFLMVLYGTLSTVNLLHNPSLLFSKFSAMSLEPD